MEHPLVKMFMPLIANSMAGPASAARPVISGLPHNDILTEALAILSDGNPEYANDLMKIATIKRDNPVMYNAIIQQLRSM
jgi:hypothetical protein